MSTTGIAMAPHMVWYISSYLVLITHHMRSVGGSESSSPYTDGSTIHITDSAYFQQEWYLGENGMNMTGAWQHCMTGTGVRIAFVDDPVCPTHPELADSYVGAQDLRPCSARDSPNHGMMTAGMAVNSPSGHCGVGASFGAKFDMNVLPLDQELTDEIEAHALRTNLYTTDLFSNSWGPSESALTWGSLGLLVRGALEDGIHRGRNGKGAIYVWAGGNGGLNDNSCAYDGFINSRYTIAVAGVNKRGYRLRTGEACSAMFASAYSQHGRDRSGIITSAGQDDCAEDFGDSSAAAPLATGAIALMLQANPALTWRDVQHIIVRTADRDKLRTRWMTNGAGYRVSSTLGFGLLNAGKMVELANNWAASVPEQRHCVVRSAGSRRLHAEGNPAMITLPTLHDRCVNSMAELEHVEVHINATYNARGHLKVSLLHGEVEVNLLPGRYQDAYSPTLDWTVMAVAFWGEDPSRGHWHLRFQKAFSRLQSEGTLHSWSVHFYGTGTPLRGWGENAMGNTPLPQCRLSTSRDVSCRYAEPGINVRPLVTISNATLPSLTACRQWCDDNRRICKAIAATTTTNHRLECFLISSSYMNMENLQVADNSIIYDRDLHCPNQFCSYRAPGRGYLLRSAYSSFAVNTLEECTAMCDQDDGRCKSITYVTATLSTVNWCYLNSQRIAADTISGASSNAVSYERACSNSSQDDVNMMHHVTMEPVTMEPVTVVPVEVVPVTVVPVTVEPVTILDRDHQETLLTCSGKSTLQVIGRIAIVHSSLQETLSSIHSLHLCRFRCASVEHEGCVSFAYHKPSHSCTLYSVPFAHLRLSRTGSRAAKTRIYQRNCTFSQLGKAFQLVARGTKHLENYLSQISVTTLSACLASCQNEERCNSVAFQETNRNCYHYSSFDSIGNQSTTDSVSYRKIISPQQGGSPVAPSSPVGQGHQDALMTCGGNYQRRVVNQFGAVVHPSLAESASGIRPLRKCWYRCRDAVQGICVSFAYQRQSELCILYYVPFEHLNLTSDHPQAVKMRIFQRNCTFSHIGEAFALVARYTKPLENYASQTSEPYLSQCLASCKNDANCNSITYHETNRICNHYNSSFSVVDETTSERTVSYRKINSSQPATTTARTLYMTWRP